MKVFFRLPSEKRDELTRGVMNWLRHDFSLRSMIGIVPHAPQGKSCPEDKSCPAGKSRAARRNSLGRLGAYGRFGAGGQIARATDLQSENGTVMRRAARPLAAALRAGVTAAWGQAALRKGRGGGRQSAAPTGWRAGRAGRLPALQTYRSGGGQIARATGGLFPCPCSLTPP